MLSNRLAFWHVARRIRLPPRAVLQPPSLIRQTRCLRAASDKAGPKKPETSTPTRPYIIEIAPDLPFPNHDHIPFLPYKDFAKSGLERDYSTIIARLTASWGKLKMGSPWGYVVIRAVYGPGTDEPWQRMLEKVKEDVRETFEYCPNAGILPERHVFTTIEDAARLDGASSHEVRDVFMEWVVAEKKIWAKPPDVDDAHCGTRYNFCLFFDAACLKKMEHSTSLQVKLLSKNAMYLEPDERNYEIYPGWEDGETEHDEEDVGWMYLVFEGYVDSYASLDDPSWWHDMQVRAPTESQSHSDVTWKKELCAVDDS